MRFITPCRCGGKDMDVGHDRLLIRSCKQSVQVPAWWRGGLKEAFAIEPDAHARTALDTEIIAREGAALAVAPPLHGDALGTLRVSHQIVHAPPSELYGRTIRHFCGRLDRFRPLQQPDRTDGG